MVRLGGTLSCTGIPPGLTTFQTPVCTFIIKALKVVGNVVGSLMEVMETVELTRRGLVRPAVTVRPFRALPEVYGEIERGVITGRVVLEIGGE